MSDILEQFYAQRRANPALTPISNKNDDEQAQKDALAANLHASLQTWTENREKYMVDLPQEEYDIINRAISNSDIPEDEAYRWATALEYNKQFGVDIADAYQNIENYNAALWGENKSFIPKTNFKAIVDYGKLGTNTLRQGTLGNQIMMAEMSGDTEKLEALLKEYEALEAENESLADYQDRRWYIEALKFGAQSAPFTGYVATAGLIGGLVSGGVGTAAAFAASMQNAMGLEYMDLRKEGATKENALAMSIFSGSLQALVETASGNVAGILGKNALGAKAKQEVIEKITGNLFKRLHYDGTFTKLALNMAGEYVKENFEEGMEEVIQDLISKGSHALAAELEGYDVDPVTAADVAKDAWENFRGGVMGSLVLGLGGTAVKTHGTIAEYKAVKDAAGKIPSEELFKKAVDKSPIFENMSEEEKKETINQIWENNKGKREEELKATEEDLAEVYSAEDKDEMYDFDDEDGNVINAEIKEAEPEQRTEDGKLYSEMPEFTENEDGTLSGEMLFGDESGENPKEYGHLKFKIDDETNKVEITEFKTKYSRDYLRNEMYADFANKFTGYDIVWDPKGNLGKSFRENITGLNPRGKDFGLNYFAINGDNNQETRIKIAQELRSNLNRSKVTDDMIAPLVAEFEALGNTFGFNVTDFYNNTFNGNIFGDVRIAQEAAFSQGKGAIRGGITLDDKAGTLDGLRAVVYAAENADFSTFSHELAHLGRRMAELQNGELSEEINKAFGIDENGWTREKEELFAEGFEDYLHTGEAKNPALKDLFSKLAELLVRMYHALHDKITLSDDMKKVYDQLLSGDDSILRMAEEAVRSGVTEQTETNTSKNVASEATAEEAPAFTINDAQLDALMDGASMEDIEALGDKPLTPEEVEALLNSMDEDRVDEIQKQMENTKLDRVTQEALTDIIEDPDISIENKAAAVMKANGELLTLKQENIDYYTNRTDITEEERAQALKDLEENNDTERNGTGISFSMLNSGKEIIFQRVNPELKKDSTLFQDAVQLSLDLQFDEEATEEDLNKAIEELDKIKKVKNDKVWSIIRDMKKHKGSEITGAKIEMAGGIPTPTGWDQMREILDIYRNKTFETFRYVLINRYTGEIYKQYAVTSKMPSTSAIVPEGRNIDYVNGITQEAFNMECGIVYVHNHPSGNVTASEADISITNLLRRASVYMGHMILDHNSYNLNTDMDTDAGTWNAHNISLDQSEDPLNKKPRAHKDVLSDYINSQSDVERMASYLNDVGADTVPVFYTNAAGRVVTLAYYPESDFEGDTLDATVEKIKKTALNSGASRIFTEVQKPSIFNFIVANNDVLKFTDALYDGYGLNKHPDIWDDVTSKAAETLFQSDKTPEQRKEELLHEDTSEEIAIKNLMKELSHEGFYSLHDAAIRSLQTGDSVEFDAKRNHNIEVLDNLLKANKGLMFYRNGDNRFRTVSLNVHPDQEGKYQVTYWDELGPILHVIHNDAESMLDDIEQDEDVHAKNEYEKILFQGNEEFKKTKKDWEERDIVVRDVLPTLFSKKETKRILKNFERLYMTPWHRQAIESVLIRADMDDLFNNRPMSHKSKLAAPSAKEYADAIRGGKEGIKKYIKSTGIIGHAAKAGNAINSSYLMCDPSEECASFCYAVTGNYAFVSPAVKSELVSWFIEKYPKDAAEITISEYVPMLEYEAGKTLRLFDKGDISEKWLPYIEALNAKDIRTQIFSKRPEILRKVDAKKNVIMLSIDKSNIDMAFAPENNDLPIAFVYGDITDLQYLEQLKDRYEQHGGVILPVKIGEDLLINVKPEAMAALPRWADHYLCPVDKGVAVVQGNKNEEGKPIWYCGRCNTGGGVGCFYHRVTAIRSRLEQIDETPLNEREEKEIYEYVRELDKFANSRPEIRGALLKELDSILSKIRQGYDPETEIGSTEAANSVFRSKSRNDGKTEETVRSGRSELGEKDLFQSEIEDVRKQYINSDKWMKAPNGSETKLTEKQWLQVRTPSFKSWFGDWENDPENASKVMDTNGEPMVVYHGTRAEEEFDVFNTEPIGDKDNVGSHFGPKGTAEEFEETKLYEVFLNLRKPFHPDFDFFADQLDNSYLSILVQMNKEMKSEAAKKAFQEVYEVYPVLKEYDIENMDDGEILDTFPDDEGLEESAVPMPRNALVDIMLEMMAADGYDGMRYENWYEGEANNECYVALKPNQIKSATDNSGAFDPTNPSILFQTAYHGSGADFDKFDTENFGLSGEGSMSFGYGTYLTGSEEIARDYGERNRPYSKNKDLDLDSVEGLANYIALYHAYHKNKSIQEMIDDEIRHAERIYNDAKENYPTLLETAKNRLEVARKVTEADVLNEEQAKLYTVEIPDNGYLQWDKEVNPDERKAVKYALFSKLVNEPDGDGEYPFQSAGAKNSLLLELDNIFEKPMNGSQLYGTLRSYLSGDKEVSNFLYRNGYVGNEYPAGTLNGNGRDARNFVIFNDEDARITGKILFQPNEEILNEARQFESWVEWMEYAQTFGFEGIPLDASSDWYLNTWEIAHNVSPTSAEKEAERLEKRDNEWKETGKDPDTLDVLWYEMIKRPGGLEAFMRRAYDVTHIDDQELAALNPDENAAYNTIRNRVDNVFANGVWRSNMIRVHNGKELTPAHRKQLLTFVWNRMRDYRALYGSIFNDPKFAVPEAETGDFKEASRAIRNHLVNTVDEWRALSPEKKNELLKYCDDLDIRKKFKQDRVKMSDDEVDAYIDLLSKDLKKLAKDMSDQRTEFLNDISDLAGMQERDILRQFADFENLANEANERKIPLPAGSKDAIRTGEKYKRNVFRGSGRTYNDLAASWATFKQEVEAKYKLQEKLRAENRIQELTEKIRAEYDARKMKNAISKAESLNAMQKEYADKRKQAQAVRELRDMRKKLVKSVMRRVDFNRIAYEQAKNIIAIQKVFEPNLYGGVNKWIGTENKLAREIWSAWSTDIEAKEKMLERLSNKGHTDLIRKLEETLTEEDFDTKWTNKDKKALERVMPRQNWIQELNLDVWKDERDNAIQLPIRQQTKVRMITQPDGTKREKVITFAEMDPEIEQLIESTLGWDMAQRIQYKFFEDWTTGEMEELARRINELYKEGRDKLAARKEAERRMADRIRSQISEAVGNTGIQINEDDPDDVKKKKQEKINKILGVSHELPGTAANGKEKQQTFIDRLLHSYHDANIRRVARILDNYTEGVMTDLLYWQENECFNRQQRSIDRRNAKIDAAIKAGNLDMRELGKVYEFNKEFHFTYDEILMLHAAKMNQDEYFAEQKKENPTLEAKDALEESSYQAIVYGNMVTAEERDAAIKLDNAILEAEKARKDALHAAELAGDEEEIKRLQQVASGSVDLEGNILLEGTISLKSKAKSRFDAIIQGTEDIRDKFRPLIDAIRKDYSEEFDRINRTSIEEFNAPVWREKWYLPLVRLTASGDTHENRLKQDLLMHSVGTGRAGTERGFTKKRIEIGPLHQSPVELGLYTTWADSVERNEHFIAYASYVRELNRVLFSKDALGTRQEIENRYGKAMKDYLEAYVKEVANPNTAEPKKGLDRVMHMMRGNTAPAYLGWKFSSILKQGIESPAPFMQFISPLEYMHGAMQLATKKWTRESIAAKSAFMQSRVFDPIADLINENVEKSFNKKSYYLKKFQQKGMEGLEWIDWACVAPGWIAIYEKEYARLQTQEQDMYEKRVAQLKEQNEARYGSTRLSEEEINRMAMDDVMSDIEIQAVNKADDCVRLCQPSNRKADLAPMFKNNSEAAKAVLQFQTALNVIWQNIRYDIPYAVKNKQYANIVGMVLGYVMAGVMSGVITKGILGGDDDDPDPKEVARRLAFYTTTQFVDSVPIMGGTLEGLAEKVITGKGSMLNTSSIFPTFDRYVNGISKLASGDYLKAVRSMEQGLQLTLGLPYSGIRELEAMFGILDGEEGLEFNPEALLGRRQ